MSRVGDYLQIQDTVLDLQVAGKAALFEAIGRHVQRVHGLPADAVAGALLRRERTGSTAVGHGVAMPHARVPGLQRIRVVYLRLAPALSFDTPDGRPITDVVVLLVPDPAAQLHLDILADAAALFGDAGFRQALHECNDALLAQALFVRWRQPVPPGARPAQPCLAGHAP
ncbi:MAG: PTS sugar transporter subunit IIA [Comamonas sp.]